MVKVTSYNQQGGITGNIVGVGGSVNKSLEKNNRKKVIISSIITAIFIIAAIVAILNYFGVTMQKESKDEQNVFVTSYNQQGGITGNQINIDTKFPRELTDDFKTQLDSMLEKFKGNPIDITAIQGDSEAYNFAEQIKEYLDSSGWETSGINVAMIFGKPQKGVIINSKTGEITVWGQ